MWIGKMPSALGQQGPTLLLTSLRDPSPCSSRLSIAAYSATTPHVLPSPDGRQADADT